MDLTVKNFIRALTPPFLWEAAHQVKVIKPITEINFSSWEEAKAAAAATYEDSELTRFRAARFAANLSAGTFPPVANRPLYWLASEFGHSFNVTDFGGSFGEYGVTFLSKFPDASYTVVETTAVVNSAPKGSVKFSTCMPDSCDVFFTSGTIQYLDDPYAIVRSGFAAAKKAVVLGRNCFSNVEMFRVQESRLFDNGDGVLPDGFKNQIVSYPLRTVSEAEIADIAANAGFNLLFRTPEPHVFLDPNVYSAMLVYVRSN